MARFTSKSRDPSRAVYLREDARPGRTEGAQNGSVRARRRAGRGGGRAADLRRRNGNQPVKHHTFCTSQVVARFTNKTRGPCRAGIPEEKEKTGEKEANVESENIEGGVEDTTAEDTPLSSRCDARANWVTGPVHSGGQG